MKQVTIDLNHPFQETLVAVLALPDENGYETADETILEALRAVYQAAHGRTVRTTIGRIAIAPAAAPQLKETPLALTTRGDLLDVARQHTHFDEPLSGDSTDRQPRNALMDFVSGRLGAPESWPFPWLDQNERPNRMTPLLTANIDLN
jgi:hypothetical protein